MGDVPFEDGQPDEGQSVGLPDKIWWTDAIPMTGDLMGEVSFRHVPWMGTGDHGEMPYSIPWANYVLSAPISSFILRSAP